MERNENEKMGDCMYSRVLYRVLYRVWWLNHWRLATGDCVCQRHRLPVIWDHFFCDERQDMLKVPRFSHAVVVATVGQGPPDFALGVADGKQLGHVRGTNLLVDVRTGAGLDNVRQRTERAHPSIRSGREWAHL